MEISCPHCSKVIRLRQKNPYHAGFSNQGFMYCDSCSATLEFGSYNQEYVKIVGDKHPWMLSTEEKAKVEDHLRPCACGGRFRFDALPRCPFCDCELAAVLPDKMHFIEIGTVVNADKDSSVWW